MQKTLVESITSLISNDGEPISYTNLTVTKSTTKYSSTKESIWRLCIDDIGCTRKTPIKITYTCITCKCSSTVSMVAFLRKLNLEDMSRCYHCMNKGEQKRMNHSQWMTGKNIRQYVAPVKDETILSLRTMYEQGKEQFLKTQKDFRDKYFQSHLSVANMEQLMPHIVGLRNGNIPMAYLRKCEYWDVFPCSNQMKFTSVFYDPTKDEIIRLDQPLVRCEECGATWKCKNLVPFIDCVKVMCRPCKLCRKTFKIRGHTNINMERITYQSKPEKAFVDWCEMNNILVRNGPYVPYEFAGKQRSYYVDFELPLIGYMVEVKDDHCWHKDQVASGKWDCKMQGVQKLLSDGVYKKYLLLTPKTKKNCLQEILSRISKI